MFDISKLAVQPTATIHIKDAAGEPQYADAEKTKPVQIVVHGPGSKAYGAVEARQSARALKRMQDNDGRITAATAEERIAETAEDLAALTIRFENFEYKTEDKATGTALFEALYRDQSLGFIARQVTKHLADWGNFKPGSAQA